MGNDTLRLLVERLKKDDGKSGTLSGSRLDELRRLKSAAESLPDVIRREKEAISAVTWAKGRARSPELCEFALALNAVFGDAQAGHQMTSHFVLGDGLELTVNTDTFIQARYGTTNPSVEIVVWKQGVKGAIAARIPGMGSHHGFSEKEPVLALDCLLLLVS